ncbi:hypothetical protein [Aestuariivirga sp.]|uniref:hypothetical protein n=1 Tax=Aestuariivirga sp. TaxID=2650926 RepID=UPI0039E55571
MDTVTKPEKENAKPKPLDRDRLMSTSRKAVAEAALEALNQVQARPANEQMLGIATVFAVYCHRFMVDPQEMHSVGLKVLRAEAHDFKTNLQIDVLRDFAGIVAPKPFSQLI